MSIAVDGVDASNRYLAALKYYPSSNNTGFYWTYQKHQVMDTANPVILKKATPNPKGSIENLFKLDSDFANFTNVKELRLDSGVLALEQSLQEGDERLLHIFHFNDFHSDLVTTSSTKGDTHYLSQIVKIVKAARQNAAANEIVLFLSAGNDHIGNPFDELLGYDVNSFQASAPYRAYSAAGLDVSVIGNHEVVPVGDIEFAERAALLTKKPVVIIGGHTHTVLNLNGLNTIYKSIPILQAGAHGTYLGEAQLALFQSKEGLRSQVQAKLLPTKKRDKRVDLTGATVKNFEQDTDIDLDFEKTVMSPLYDLLGGRLKEVIGQAGNVPEIAQDKALAERYLGQSTMANFMNDAIVARSKDFPARQDGSQLVDLAVFNASGVNGGIAPNAPITFTDWYNVMPFADLIVVTKMTGAQIKTMVQSNAQRIVRPEQLKENGGIVTADDLKGYGVSYGFLHFSRGLTYILKLGNSPAEATALDIRLTGRLIDEVLDQNFNVAFGDYLAKRGAESWKGETNATDRPSIGLSITALPQSDTGLIYRNEIIKYIKDNGVVDSGSGAAKDSRLTVVP